MMGETVRRNVDGWEAPCVPFDYSRLEREARRECDAIKQRLDVLNRTHAGDAEKELLRRREVRILTDMYYEQRHNADFFAGKAGKM